MSRNLPTLLLLTIAMAGNVCAATVAGTVYAPDGPLPGVFIVATDSNGAEQRVLTAATGKFRIAGLQGTTVLRALLEGFAEYERILCIGDADLDIVIGMNLGPTFGCWAGDASELRVRGDVLDEEGQPLDDVSVEVLVDGVLERTARTDPEGRFRFVLPARFPLAIRFTKRGFVEQIVEMGDMTDAIEVRLYKPGGCT